MSPTLAVAAFVVGVFVVAIGLHEWGHFITARRFGMRADKYFLGFGPTLWSTRRGETEYGVKLLPLGGFVRIKGMNPGDERLRPVADAVFDRDRVAEDRRALAESQGRDVTEVDAVPPATWQRLDDELDQRGTPATLRHALIERTRAAAGPQPTAAAAAAAFTQVADEAVEDTGRVGDLRHRVLRGDDGRFFHDRPAWQRATVLAAGSTMHFAQAAVLVFLSLLIWGTAESRPVVDEIVTQVARNDTCDPDADASCLVSTPAADAGLEVGDRIVAVDGQPVDDFEVIRGLIAEHAGRAMSLTVERGGQQRTLELTPRAVERDGETVGYVGFAPVVEEVALGPGEAVVRTFVGDGSLTHATVETIKALGRVFGPEGFGSVFAQVTGEEERSADGAASPIGIGRMTAEGAQEIGPIFVVAVLASINVFIGVFNLVPLPPLDGGHLAIVGVEKAVNSVRRRRGQRADFTVDPRTIATIAVPVVLLIGTMFLAVVWLDLTNPVQLP